MKPKGTVKNLKLSAKALAEQIQNRPASKHYEIRLGFAVQPFVKADKKKAIRALKRFVKALNAFDDNDLLSDVVLYAGEDVSSFNAKLIQDAQKAALEAMGEQVEAPAPSKS